jgi:nucleotide-binding universal stress UspA family protein
MDAPFTDILVPLDGSPAAERALGPALQLVGRTGVALRVLAHAQADDKEVRAEYLAGVADRHAALADIETEVVDGDSIPRAIAEGMEPGTLVCMSSHGRGGLARALLGSVAEALLRRLDLPALIVGPRSRRASRLPAGSWPASMGRASRSARSNRRGDGRRPSTCRSG